MEITYDPQVDALYIKLMPGKHQVIAHTVDDDIALNFDDQERLVGVEVLAASKRLDLKHLLPQAQILGEQKSANLD